MIYTKLGIKQIVMALDFIIKMLTRTGHNKKSEIIKGGNWFEKTAIVAQKLKHFIQS